MNRSKYAREVAEQLKQHLIQRGHTFAVAESLTGGNLGASLTSVSGSSAYFLGGVVAYHIDVKVALLGVNRDHAAQCDCVSSQVAREMAEGVRKLLGSDVGLATTGYAERPSPDKVQHAYIGLSTKDGRTETMLFTHLKEVSRQAMQQRTVQAALNFFLASELTR